MPTFNTTNRNLEAMTKLIPAKCPSCGANLEFPEDMEVGHCMHCGGKVIIDREVHVHGQTAIACPDCDGKGYFICKGKKEFLRRINMVNINRVSCEGTGKCTLNVSDVSDPCLNGKCIFCKGTGKIGFFKCNHCKGTGKCLSCLGTGKCSFCNGAGKSSLKCDACDGTGFKIYKPK